ncbi:MAG: aspartyl protease family protein [Caulobacteraceae bacterium]
MQDALAAFFSTQLDFIFFFYGLAFILLGNVCFAIARLPDRKVWQVLGGFGVLHGLGEWLDLMALVVGDSAAFALVRLALMTVSFLLLLEFARRQAVLSPVRPPGPWIHFLLAALVVVAALAGGPSAANATARYAIAFVGAISVSGVFAWQAFTQLSGAARRLALLTALGLALYGVAAGLIVPAAPFWPASVVNQTGFLHLTGVPIQLVRGVLACWVAGAVWAVWGRLVAREVASESYTAYLQRQLLWAAIGMLAILSGGWVLTQDLGGVYERGLETESRGDLDLLASRMAGETAAVDSMIRALAGSPEVVDRLTRGGDPEAARRTLALDAEASGAAAGYLLDRAGSVVAAVGSSAAPGGGARPYLAGAPGRLFTVDGPNVGYDASQAVRRPDGAVVGTAILHRSLAGADADLAGFDRAFYLVDGAGVVRMTNRPAQRLQRLWPTPATAAAGAGVKPILPRTVADAGWVESDGHRQFVRRRNLGQGGWSLVIITPTEGIFASRVLGIIITLLAAMTTLVFLFGRERLVRDHVQMDRRLELQALAPEPAPPRRHRPPHRPRQPPGLGRSPGPGDRAGPALRHAAGPGDLRHRPLQADQRRPWPPGRRRCSRAAVQPGRGPHPRQRPLGPVGRGGVRPADAAKRPRHRGPGGREAARRRLRRTVRGHRRGHLQLRRRRTGRGGRRPDPDRPRRRGALPGQDGRPQPRRAGRAARLSPAQGQLGGVIRPLSTKDTALRSGADDASRLSPLAADGGARVSGAARAACSVQVVAELPVTMTLRKPLVPARINGHDVMMIVDSGAAVSGFPPDSAARLGVPSLAPQGRLEVRTFGASAPLAVGSVKDFELAGAVYHDVQFLVGGGIADVGAAGRLGENVLGGEDAEYDLGAGALRMLRPHDCEGAALAYWAKDGAVASLRIEHLATTREIRGLVTVNGVAVRAMFDTGSPFTYLDRAAAGRAGVDLTSSAVQQGRPLRGVSGGLSGPVLVTRARDLKIGGRHLGGAVLRVTELGTPDHEMIIGLDFFMTHRVAVDTAHDALYFTENGAGAAQAPP